MGSLGFGCCIYRNCVQCLRLLCLYNPFVITLFIYPNSAGYPEWRWGKCMINPVGYNRLELIDQSHKSDKISVSSPTMHHFVTEMCTNVHISVTKSALWDIWCIVGFIIWIPTQHANTICIILVVYCVWGCRVYNLVLLTECHINVVAYKCLGTINTGTKCPAFRRHFEQLILDRKRSYFIQKFFEMHWQQNNIGSDNGLVPVRWQGTTWTNTDPVHISVIGS